LLDHITERPETIELGTARLVGMNRCRIVEEALDLLANEAAYLEMAKRGSPFGDGHAAKRIVAILRSKLVPASVQHTEKLVNIGAMVP
jgi:UDP-N-acetylglucosamine 2-epimerase (hydrolysing)